MDITYLLIQDTIDLARRCLSDDLRNPKYQGNSGMAGYCYVTSEAVYHLCGTNILKPCVMWVGEETHWFLYNKITGVYHDPTFDQFNEPLDYTKGRGCGFLTAKPSKRGLTLIERIMRLRNY